MNNYIKSLIVLTILLLSIIFFVPPFHWTIIAVFIVLSATAGGLVVTIILGKYARFAVKKRSIGIISIFLFSLALTLLVLNVLTPLNILLVILLGVSLLAL